LPKTFHLDPELKAMCLDAPSFASRVAVLSNGFRLENYCRHSYPMQYKNIATVAFTRWADVSKAVHHVVVMTKAIIGFQNVRDERSAAITLARYIPFTAPVLRGAGAARPDASEDSREDQPVAGVVHVSGGCALARVG
jgi:hypothetical protein